MNPDETLQNARKTMTRVSILQKAREVVRQGWCQSYVGVTTKGVPTNHIGHNEPVLDKKGNPVLDEKGQPTFVWHPTVRWSLVGALMVACEVGPSTYPNEAFGDITKCLTRLVQRWTFSHGTYQFNFLADFNDHSAPRAEEFDENGKKLRPKDLERKYGSANHNTTVEDVVRLLDWAIALANAHRLWAKLELNANYPAWSNPKPYIDQMSSENRCYDPALGKRVMPSLIVGDDFVGVSPPMVAPNPEVFRLRDEELARQITETGQRIIRAVNAANQLPVMPGGFLDTDSAFTTRTDAEKKTPCHPDNGGYLGPVLDQKVKAMTGNAPRATIAAIESREDLGDNLSLYRVLGNPVVGMKEKGQHRFEVGELVPYIPENMIVPDAHLKDRGYWDERKGKGLLGGSKGNRVKMRVFCKTEENPDGQPSIGLIWKLVREQGYEWFLITPDCSYRVFEGDDVTDKLELTVAEAK